MTARSFLVVTVVVLAAFCQLVSGKTGSVSYYGGGVYKYSNGIDKLAVSYGEYVDEVQTDGWGKLHIETNSQYGDEVQMHAAGYLEGYLTADRIYQQFINIYSVFWTNTSNPIPAVVLKWLDDQNTWVRVTANKNKVQDHYWGQVANVLAQFDGLAAGYNDYMAIYDPKKNLSSLAFSILNGVGDLLDVTAAFSSERPKKLR